MVDGRDSDGVFGGRSIPEVGQDGNDTSVDGVCSEEIDIRMQVVSGSGRTRGKLFIGS